nr:MAG TPA: hypothetical protein [Caudoviricetes sp.]
MVLYTTCYTRTVLFFLERASCIFSSWYWFIVSFNESRRCSRFCWWSVRYYSRRY